MRMILAAAGLAVLLSPQTSVAEDVNNCDAIGQLAEAIMIVRQKEVPMTKAMDAMLATQTNQAVKDFIRSVIMMAYKEPAMRTDRNKRDQVARFRNEQESACYEVGLDRY